VASEYTFYVEASPEEQQDQQEHEQQQEQYSGEPKKNNNNKNRTRKITTVHTRSNATKKPATITILK
jgi:hypothetical protein